MTEEWEWGSRSFAPWWKCITERSRPTANGLGQGSQFIVRLPLVTKLLPRSDDTTVASLRGQGRGCCSWRTILTLAKCWVTILKLDGFEVECAEDGQQGLDAILARRPNVAVIDIGLPRLDGYEVARRVREQYGRSEIYLVALTGLRSRKGPPKRCSKPDSTSIWSSPSTLKN